MNRFPLIAEFLDGVLDAHVEGVLLDIANLADVIFEGVDPVVFVDEDYEL